jgi:hypothetical protein
MKFKVTLAKFFQPDKYWYTIFGTILLVYLYLALVLTTSYDFNDETEKLIVARLLVDKGLRLYKEVFVQHGPVAYIPSHILNALIPNHSLAFSRIIPIILSLLSLGAIMASPLFTIKRSQLFAGTLFLSGLIFFQAHYGLVMNMYQVYAGYFIVIPLALFIIPFSIGIVVKPWQSVLAGFSLSMLFFCAFPFGLIILFCLLLCLFSFFLPTKASTKRALLGYCVAGGVGGILFVAIWLWLYGDIVGYFIAHFYINLFIFIKHLPFTSIDNSFINTFLHPFTYIEPKPYYALTFFKYLSNFSALLLCFVIYKWKLFGNQFYRYILYSLCLLLIVKYSDPRACYYTFAGTSCILVLITFIALVSAFIFEKRNLLSPIFTKTTTWIVILFFASAICTQYTIKTFLYNVSPSKYYKYKRDLKPLDDDSMNLLRYVVSKKEGVAQFPLNLAFYVEADRLPAFGIFYWMPYMEDYANNPLPSYPLELCRQMNEAPPKAISYTDMQIGNRPPDTYLACFKKLLKERYFSYRKADHIWFRDDVAAAHEGILVNSHIPEDYNNPSLPKKSQDLINSMKLHYSKLGTMETGQCIIAPKQGNKTLQVDQCHNEQALNFSFNKDGNKLFSLQSRQCLDSSVGTSDVKHSLRLWPCHDTIYQNFVAEKAGDGFYIHNKENDLCLAIEDSHLIQTSCNKATKWRFHE